jgi:hypothetical protein
MIDKIKYFSLYLFCLLTAIIITGCSNNLPVKVGFQDEGFKSYYSSKGGLEVVIDKTSNK